MKTSERFLAPLLLVIVLAGRLPNESQAQNYGTIAIGKVAANGTLRTGHSTVGGTIDIVKDNGEAGLYTLTINAPGAFAGVNGSEEFHIEARPAGAAYQDDAVVCSHNGFSTDHVSFKIRSSDVEHSLSPSHPIRNNLDFIFLIRRVNFDVLRIPSDTGFLVAAGSIASSGGVENAVGVGGVTIESTRTGTGNYSVTLSKPGAFRDDSYHDYIVLATPIRTGSNDIIAAGAVSTVGDNEDDSVTVQFRTSDVQSATASSSATPLNEDFYFSIYRVTEADADGLPASNLLLASAYVWPDGGTYFSGGTSLPGVFVFTKRISGGDYEVTVNAENAFVGRSPEEFSGQVTILSNVHEDKIGSARCRNVTDHRVVFAVSVCDAEEDGSNFGIPKDEEFYLSIIDTRGVQQPDLRIGSARKPAKMRGNNLYRRSGAGQAVKKSVSGRGKERFYFATENDGNTTDGVRLSEVGARGAFDTRYFAVSGGRRNVTAAIRKKRVVDSDLRPSEITVYMAEVGIRKPTKKSLKIQCRSVYPGGSADGVKASIVPRG